MACTDMIFNSEYQMSKLHFLKNIKGTSISENSNQLDAYFKQELKIIGPDSTFLESDHARRDNYSGDILNLRHYGSRASISPHSLNIYTRYTMIQEPTI